MSFDRPNQSRQSRRRFCQAVTAAASATLLPAHVIGDETHTPSNSVRRTRPADADSAIQRLIRGNKRFAEGKARHPHESPNWRHSLESGQHPYAVILGCADSRVCPELLFDQGFGDLFVIRVAGNIIDVDVTASIEYAVDHLDSMLVVVLGHTHCGAVTATLDHLAEADGEPKEIVSLLHRIEPAIAGVPQGLAREDRINLAVEANVRYAVERLSAVPDMKKNVRRRNVRIVGAVYDMHTGIVNMLDAADNVAAK